MLSHYLPVASVDVTSMSPFVFSQTGVGFSGVESIKKLLTKDQ